ncbi:hypothetical protein LST1_22310 [Neisseria elongata]|jgi:hypothetical protein|uniref:hypothetical protein n=1 Tax=Neisseria elongata TaxID=495 RepID=UPI002852DFD9|nr:hypothetical protein LST1_22310 [Neisseria elongata]
MKNNDEMVFALDEFQQRYLEDLETKEWLERVIRKAGEEQFPLLKANIKGKDLNPILDDVVRDAREYGFEDDDRLLVRYGIYAVNNGVTPMDNPELAREIRKSETVALGIEDQIALADWAARNYEMFGMEVEWGE